MTKATVDSWKSEPKPNQTKNLSYSASFTGAEVEKISLGIIPRDMEDKWFIYQHEGWVYFHRSWTGTMIYWLKLVELSTDHYQVCEVGVNRNPQEYKETDDSYDIQMLDFLIRCFLLDQQVEFPMKSDIESPKGVYQHVATGTAFPETIKRVKPWWKIW